MAELYETAVETNLMLAPANSPRQLIESRQLEARDFFCELRRPPTSPAPSWTSPAPATPWSHPDRSGRPGPGPAPSVAGAPRAGTGPVTGAPTSGPAWAGTKILEFGTGAAGPIAIRYFAEHGATVVRIESRSRPDFLRTYGMGPGNPCGLEGSDMFDALNVGKLGVTLNLKHPEGVALAKRLMQWTDAVAENFAPGPCGASASTTPRWSAEKPDLVMVSSCLQGQTGPHKDYPGFGGQGSALGRLQPAHRLARPGAGGPFGTITDSLAPRFVATALAAGLLYRRRTGRGVHLDVAQVEAAVYSLSPWVPDYDVNGHTGSARATAPTGPCPTGPSPAPATTAGWPWPAGTTTTGPAWPRIIGLDDATAGRLATVEARPAAVDEVEALVVGLDGVPRRPARWPTPCRPSGIEAVPVADLGDASADPQLAHRHHFVTLEHPCMGACGYERNGFRLSDAPAGYKRTSPTLGEHNELVLGEILGLGAAEQRRLLEDGVLE